MFLTYSEIKGRGLDTNRAQRMGWDELGRDLVVDGIEGPKTRGGLFLDPDVITAPVARVALAELLAGAQEAVGVNNKGEYPKKYMPPSFYGGAWCAGFASWCLASVYADAPSSVGAQRLGKRVAARGDKIVDARLVMPDDLMIWNRDGSDEGDDPWDDANGHVGIVVHVGCEWIYTIDGNKGRGGIVRVFRHRKADPGTRKSPWMWAARLCTPA